MLCPNCSYPKLVLLSNRRKYKCAKCSRLFFQKEIESKEFRIWNKKQKELDLHNFNLEFKKEWDNITELRKTLRQMFKPSKNSNKEYEKLWRAKNKEKIQTRERVYYNKHKDKINAQRRLRWKLNSKTINEIKRLKRSQNPALSKLDSKINYWKQQQKALADNILKFKQEETYNTILAHSVPTFLLCEQL